MCESSSNVVDMEDYRPHLMMRDPLTGNCQVMPVSLAFRWLNDDPTVEAPDAETVRSFIAYALLDMELIDIDSDPLPEGA